MSDPLFFVCPFFFFSPQVQNPLVLEFVVMPELFLLFLSCMVFFLFFVFYYHRFFCCWQEHVVCISVSTSCVCRCFFFHRLLIEKRERWYIIRRIIRDPSIFIINIIGITGLIEEKEEEEERCFCLAIFFFCARIFEGFFHPCYSFIILQVWYFCTVTRYEWGKMDSNYIERR